MTDPGETGTPGSGGVLAAIDFSDATDAVAEVAARLAVRQHTQLHIVHVAAAESELAGYDRGPVVAHTRDERAGELLDEHQRLADLAADLEAEHVGLRVTPIVAMGATVDQLLAEATRVGADHIVAGSHGHGALHHLLVGSVSEGLLRHASLPVTIVPVGRR